MSKNNKNAKRIAKAREFATNRKNGNKGSSSGSASKKRNAWWQKFPSYSSFLKGGKKPRREQAVEAENVEVSV